jgi:hypothetical protein
MRKVFTLKQMAKKSYASAGSVMLTGMTIGGVGKADGEAGLDDGATGR